MERSFLKSKSSLYNKNMHQIEKMKDRGKSNQQIKEKRRRKEPSDSAKKQKRKRTLTKMLAHRYSSQGCNHRSSQQVCDILDMFLYELLSN
jgi:hypothetical protein